MKAIKLISVFLILSNSIFAQQNLIPNPSFEEYFTCEYKLNTEKLKNVVLNWSSRRSSPRYFNEDCFNNPNSDYYRSTGFADAQQGLGYVSSILAPTDDKVTNVRQYLQVELIEKMSEGKEYILSYYVTLPIEDQDPLSHYGVNFTDSLVYDTITNVGRTEPILLVPTLEIDTLMDLNYNEWQKVTHCFQAIDDYSVMTVGIFANVDDIIGAFDIKNGLTYIAYDNFELYKIDSLIDLEITKNDTICVGECVTLSTNHSLIEGEFVWDLPGSDIGTSRDSVITVCYGKEGIYDVGISVDHCIGTYDNYFTKAITVISAIEHTPPWEEMTVCAGEEVSIDLSFVNYNIEWEDGSINNKRKFSKDGIYKYTLSNGYCKEEYVVQVIYDIQPTTQLIEVQSCRDESIEYNDKTYDKPGTYIDTLMSSKGCDSIFYNIKYSYFEYVPIELDGPFGFCLGESLKLNVISNHTELIWSDSNRQKYIVVDKAGQYTITGLDNHLCFTELKFKVEQYPIPEVETEDILDIWYEEGMELPVTYMGTISEYAWSMSEALDCGNCPYPKLIQPIEGNYEIVVKNDFGSDARSVVEISFKKANLYLPNIIAKNSALSGNGTFFVQSDLALKYDLTIYDRWGDVLYHADQINTNEASQGWRPKANVNPGVFVYKVSYLEIGKRIILSGDITVL